MNSFDPESAWKSVYTDIRAELLAQATRLTGNAEDAQDILQDVYVRALEFVGAGGDLRQPDHWLRRAVRNAAVDRIRARKSTLSVEETQLTAIDTPDPEQVLDGCLTPLANTLPSIYADALLNTDLGQGRMRDLAERHGIGLSAAKSRVQRARSQLTQEVRRCCEAIAGASEPYVRSLGHSACCPVAGALKTPDPSGSGCCH